MKTNQLTRGETKRVMFIENKDGLIDGVAARIGWVRFSKTGRTVYYRGRELVRLKGGGVRGNHLDVETREEYWVSGIKKRGQNTHQYESVSVQVDDDALSAYEELRSHAE